MSAQGGHIQHSVYTPAPQQESRYLFRCAEVCVGGGACRCPGVQPLLRITTDLYFAQLLSASVCCVDTHTRARIHTHLTGRGCADGGVVLLSQNLQRECGANFGGGRNRQRGGEKRVGTAPSTNNTLGGSSSHINIHTRTPKPPHAHLFPQRLVLAHHPSQPQSRQSP